MALFIFGCAEYGPLAQNSRWFYFSPRAFMYFWGYSARFLQR
jgi:hypothetical protein